MRPAIAELPASKIREVANAALGRADVLPFWFGESDEATPVFIREAAVRSLNDGETFYAHNLGLPELRRALAAYVSGLHRPVAEDRIAVTSSGVNALMLAIQALVGPGDEVVAVVPLWPNLTAQPAILGATVKRVSLTVREGAWTLDMDALLAAVTPATTVLLLNAPNNPTGWTLTRAEQQTLLEHCRRTGTWILADEVYERVFFGAPAAAEPPRGGRTPPRGAGAAGDVGTQSCAPSFLDLAQPDDRLVVAHSFSKSFLMTGWRLGWLVLPPTLVPVLGTLIEFNTSCAPVFVQRAGLAALAGAAEFVPGLTGRLKHCRDALLPQLLALPGISVATPAGGMYAFFRIEGQDDSLALAKRLVVEAGLGLAPGVAFGPEGEGWLRWCFASKDPARLDQGVVRLKRFLGL
jgi:aspartate/methionine/tyrosine aminotransferase